MGKVLDDLINNKCSKLKVAEGISENELELYRDALKEKFKADVINEIIEEEAKRLLKESLQLKKEKRIKEVKFTIFSGVFLSFFLGLIVNQITDVIGYLKGSITLSNLASTLWTLVGLTIITGLILFLLFLDNVLNLLNEREE